MSDDLFDIERLRKNWASLPEEEPVAELPGVLRRVGIAPPEPLQRARELLERMRQLAGHRFPDQRDTLEAFFHEAQALLEAYQRQGPIAPVNPDTPPQEAPPDEAPRAEPLVAVESTLDRLEELLEVFTLEPEFGQPPRRA